MRVHRLIQSWAEQDQRARRDVDPSSTEAAMRFLFRRRARPLRKAIGNLIVIRPVQHQMAVRGDAQRPRLRDLHRVGVAVHPLGAFARNLHILCKHSERGRKYCQEVHALISF